jgi:DNA-binding transcriptional LysR family regulator
MDRLDAIKIFVRVVESGGSFTAVARELGLRQPTVSKQIAALEEHLGAQLLMRTSRSLSLTEAGRDFFESAAKTIGELEAAESRIGHGLRSPTGRVRVAIAPGFGELFVVPRLPAFFKRYPHVTLDVIASERPANLVEDGFDVAIRNGAMVESSLVARKIGSTAVVVVASPEYLAKQGEPQKPSDLDHHSCIVFLQGQIGPHPWVFAGRSGTVSYPVDGSFRTNDAQLIRTAILGGMGAAQVPYWLFPEELASGRVTRILRRYEPSSIPISAVRPANRRLPTRVSVFIDFVAEALAESSP